MSLFRTYNAHHGTGAPKGRTRMIRVSPTIGVLLLLVVSSIASGCRHRSIATSSDVVTFSEAAVVFQRWCQSCHRPGQIGPFSLTTFADAYAHRDAILEAVTTRKMPPWKAVPGHGDFANARHLNDAEIDVVKRWVIDGAREGDPRRLPPPLTFPIGWELGPPDMV